MKIVVTERKADDYGEGEMFRMDVDGKHCFTAGRGEPEDNYLDRDLNFVYEIAPLMKKAWEAGKKGEEFTVEEKEAEEE